MIESAAGKLVAVEYDTIRNAADLPHSTCLKNVYERTASLIGRTYPDAAALEGGFFFKNAKTAMILGQVRGVVIAVCASAGVPVFEYSPRAVKQGLTGFGGASKDHVARIVMSILGLKGSLQEDAGDALAVAICHSQRHGGIAVLQNKPI